MKYPLGSLRAVLVVSAFVSFSGPAMGGTATWNGGGQDNYWQNPANWGGTPPSPGDALTFQGTVRLNNTNNFGAGTSFNGITFASPSAAFNLFGNPISLTSDIVNNQVVVNETINLPLALDATHNLNVTPGGSLVVRGPISAPVGAGLTLPGGGQVTLAATNTFPGAVTVNAGTLTVFSDANLGATNASPTAGRLVISGGTLQTTNTFAINANRGIAVGPASGTGSATFDVNQGAAGTGQPILTYQGVIANNGAGTGGLTKIGFGGLTLAGANTYTGPTAHRNGFLTLDFTQASSPTNDVINKNSALTLGGATSGRGVTNYAGLVVIPKGATVTNSQTFNNTFIDIGEAFVRGTSNNLGTININLGLLTHTNGGVVNIIPPTLQNGKGSIITSATNVNGILGGWVTIGDGHLDGNRMPYAATNWASVDANSNIVNYTGYTVYSSGNLSGVANPANNVFIPGSVTGDVTNDVDLAFTTNDFNTIAMNRSVSWTLNVGVSNTLRLGKTGALFNQLNTAGVSWGIGGGTAGAAGPQAGAGFITAGGPTVDTPGELIVINNTTGSSSSQNMSIDSQVVDNGTGAVTLVKAGPGFLKLRNHNSYSGGTYILQGRIQLDNSLTGGTPIFDAFGTGPVFIFPGGNIFFSGTSPGALPNEFFVAGNSTQQEPGIGCIRTTGGWAITNTVHLIGDTTIGGSGGISGCIGGRITGNFALSLGSAGTVNGTISISNSLNDWTGDTTIQGRTLNNSGANTFISGGSEIIPNGFGKGNVIMSAGTTATVAWNLNNMTETINGLSAVNPQNCSITTGGSLIVGDNDQSGTFGGTIQDAISVTKIGGGTETFTGDKLTYTGTTTVNGGTLALTGSAGALPSSPVQVNPNTTLDVSGISGGAIAPLGIGIDTGRFIGNAAGAAVTSLAVTNAHLQVVLNPAVTCISGVSTLTTGGATNLIDVSSIQNVASYPAQFTVIKYGTLGGAGFNFGLGAVPTGTTTGYVSNNVGNNSVDVVLFNGPKLLSWVGTPTTNWDIVGTANWKFGASASVYNDQDSVLFDNTASQTLVNLTTILTPASISVNSSSNYVFGGSGNIVGFASLTKSGTGKLTIANSGVDSYSGGVTVSGGIMSFGVSNNISGGITLSGATLELTAGNLPSGNIVSSGNGVLLLDGTGSVTVNNNISDDGSGLVIKTNTGTATLGGISTYSAQTLISQGTMVAASSGAANGSSGPLGSSTGNTIIANGATLDVGGQNLGAEPVVVSGAGVGGNGAIVNSGAAQLNALLNVTLAGNTTFGGTNRWDIRGTAASLVTDGLGYYNITKIGTNQVSIVGAAMDGAVSNIFVQAGMLGIETTTSGSLGENIISKLTVSAGATLELFNNNGNALSKPLVFNGDGVTDSLLNNSGANHITSQSIVLNSGNCILDIGGTSLALDDNGSGNVVSGAGGLTKTGAGVLAVNIPLNYAGATVVSNGVMLIDVPQTNTSTMTVGGGSLAVGNTGWLAGQVNVLPGGTLSPGDTNFGIPAYFTLAISNALSLSGNVAMDVTKNGDSTFTSDVITNVTALTFGGSLTLNIDTNGSALVLGDAIKLFSFNSASGTFASIVPATPGLGLAWDQSHLPTDGTLRVKVASAAPPVFNGIRMSWTTVTLSATNGSAGANWTLLQSTNIALPLSLWDSNRTVIFDSNGNLSTNIDNATNSRLFYLLKQ